MIRLHTLVYVDEESGHGGVQGPEMCSCELNLDIWEFVMGYDRVRSCTTRLCNNFDY